MFCCSYRHDSKMGRFQILLSEFVLEFPCLNVIQHRRGFQATNTAFKIPLEISHNCGCPLTKWPKRFVNVMYPQSISLFRLRQDLQQPKIVQALACSFIPSTDRGLAGAVNWASTAVLFFPLFFLLKACSKSCTDQNGGGSEGVNDVVSMGRGRERERVLKYNAISEHEKLRVEMTRGKENREMRGGVEREMASIEGGKRERMGCLSCWGCRRLVADRGVEPFRSFCMMWPV